MRAVTAEARALTLTTLLTLAPTPQWLLHANVGVSHRAGRNRGIWAAAAEYTINERCEAQIEAFGEYRGSPTLQFCARYWSVPNQVQTDTSLVHQPRIDGAAGDSVGSESV